MQNNAVLEVLSVNKSPDFQAQATKPVYALESGKVLFIPNFSFELLPHEFGLISPTYSDGKAKNISLDTAKKNLPVKGLIDKNNPNMEKAFRDLLTRYAKHCSDLIDFFIPEYKNKLQIGRTSFRPVEIEGRKAPSYRKDDTRLHVDAFPANPNQGKRLLRVFCNIHPKGKPRCWKVGAPFHEVAKTFLPQIKKPLLFSKQLLNTLKITKSPRSEYDHIMLNIHNKMKHNLDYQQTVPYTEINFPSRSTWIVFTDSVSHAALSGQHLLEQTFYLKVEDMQNPLLSPLKILEKLTHTELV